MSIQNRRAKFDYEIKETYVAGIVLESNEVKHFEVEKPLFSQVLLMNKKVKFTLIILKLFQEIRILTSKRKQDLLKNFYLIKER